MILGGQIIGFAVVNAALLHLMMVDVPFQQKGHGSALLSHMEKVMFERYRQISLQTFRDNARAVSFYLKNGWKAYGDVIFETDIAMLQFTQCNKYTHEAG